jgi:2-hydroxychromene-2-carboxylate isomerase
MITLYFDLASSYAYLAVARARDVLGVEPELEPILLGAIFQRRGHGSWAHTGERDRNVAEIEGRARRYGLPPLVWPREWPANSLAAMRAATWAKQHGAAAPFAHAAYRRHFAQGADIADVAVLEQVADSVGLPGPELRRAIAQPELKLALRAATDAAWERGVTGVPCLAVGDDTFYGDDRLEEAAEAVRRSAGAAKS